MVIQSTKNERIKEWKKLHTKKGRSKTSQYIIEGDHLVEEAVLHNASIDNVIISEERERPIFLQDIPSEQIVSVSKNVAAYLAETETTQGIFAIISMDSNEKPSTLNGGYLFLDAVQDPGNVGTMIRTADSLGFSGVVLGVGTVDVYNEKTLRSAQGSHFHIDVWQGELEEWMDVFQAEKYPVYGTALDEKAVSIPQFTPPSTFALIMGSEGSGVGKKLLERTDANLYIPMRGQAESLNVAVAAGIVMYQLVENKESM